MNVSSVGASTVLSHLQSHNTKPVASTKTAQVSAPSDSDGDHDGSTASPGRLDVKA